MQQISNLLKIIYAFIIVIIVFFTFYYFKLDNNTSVNNFTKLPIVSYFTNKSLDTKQDELNKSSLSSQLEEKCKGKNNCDLLLSMDDLKEIFNKYFRIKKIDYFTDFSCKTNVDLLNCTGFLTAFANCNIQFVNVSGKLELKDISLNNLGIKNLNENVIKIEQVLKVNDVSIWQTLLNNYYVNNDYQIVAEVIDDEKVKFVLSKNK